MHNKKIKLVIALPNLHCGGSEKYISMLCRNISKDKFSVTLLLLNNDNPFYDPGQDITIINLQKSRARQAVGRIRDIVRQEQPDIFLSAANHLTVVMGLFRWMFPRRMLLLARESSLVSSNSQYARQPWLYRQLLRRCYKRIDHIICQSKAMQQDLVERFDVEIAKTIVLHNPVERIPDAGYGMRDMETTLFITVGRLSKEKRIDHILDALSLLDIPFVYHIIGDGDQREPLEKKVKALGLQDTVCFSGQQSYPYHDVENAALFLMASSHEGFPNSLLEAGALGIPVVACDAPGGIAEIVKENINGFLVKDGSATAFADTVRKAVYWPFDRELIRTMTLENFDIHRHTGQLENILMQYMEEK